MSIVKRALGYIEERKKKLESGGINSIPTPFKRFSSDYVGVEQSTYYIVTAKTKVGKTQIASYMFLYNPILYAFYNPDKIRVKIHYYSLEEEPIRIVHRFMSYLLYLFYKIEISPRDLRSTTNNPLPQDILDKLNLDPIKEILDFFDNVVVFSEERNPTGIRNEILKYLDTVGTTHKIPKKYKDEFGNIQEIMGFGHYEQNDPNLYNIFCIDHISLCQNERGYTKKETIDKLSEYFVDLRNRYGIIPVVIQQQASNTSAENIKSDLVRPTEDNLSDSKYTAKDASMLLGLFSPFAYKIDNYLGYDITLFKDEIRFLEVLLSRDGSKSGMIALRFKGASCHFEELPLPGTPELETIYQELRAKQLEKRKKSSISFLTFIKNKFNG